MKIFSKSSNFKTLIGSCDAPPLFFKAEVFNGNWQYDNRFLPCAASVFQSGSRSSAVLGQNRRFCFHSVMTSHWKADVRITWFSYTVWPHTDPDWPLCHNRKHVAFRACWESLMWWKQRLRQKLLMSNEFPPSAALTSSAASVENKWDLLVLSEIF